MKRLLGIIFNHFWAKIISIVLAAATWFYVFDLINSDSFSQRTESPESVFSRYDFVVKEVPVKPVFYGKSPVGCRVDYDNVKIVPSRLALYAPKSILIGVTELHTDRIDVGEYTRSVKLTLRLHSNVKTLPIEEKTVDVYIPVISEEKEQ